MQFGNAIGTACLTFVLTNIDDAFVLVTFFAESSTSRNLTPLKITLGQYIGFTVIVVVSLIGFAVAVALPSEPIGFLGLLPILLGVWKFFDLLFPKKDDTEEEESESQRIANAKSVFKVALITIMNGGDNIGTYIPLFSQAKGAEVAVYVVVYYILLGIWCFIAFLIMKQRHILRLAEKYASFIIPFLYLGLGIYIVVKSNCYPWSVKEIDDDFLGDPGKIVMGVMTACLLSSIMGMMVWFKMRKMKTKTRNEEIALTENTPALTKGENDRPLDTPESGKNADNADTTVTEQPGKDCEETETRSIEAGPNAEQLQSDNKVQPKATPGDSEIQAAS
jgi:cadmium resistance protein CadD (predicted permease)